MSFARRLAGDGDPWFVTLRAAGGEPRAGTSRKGGTVAATATRTLKNFVNGEYVEPASGRYSDVVNPATGEVYAQAPISGDEDVDRAYAAASARLRGVARLDARRASARAAALR